MQVINLFGAPGVGKTLNALYITAHLKAAGVKAEFANEWIKDKVYEGTPYPFNDQIYTFAKQRKKMLERLSHEKLEVIVTDSPLIMGLAYVTEFDDLFTLLVNREFSKMNNLNFLLVRDPNVEYDPVGRIQSNAAEADLVLPKIKEVLAANCVKYIEVMSSNGIDRTIADLVLQGVIRERQEKALKNMKTMKAE